MRVGPLQIVEEAERAEHDRPTRATSASSTSTSSKLRLRTAERAVRGRCRPSAGRRSRSTSTSAERVTEHRRKRHVREVLARAPKQLAQPTRTSPSAQDAARRGGASSRVRSLPRSRSTLNVAVESAPRRRDRQSGAPPLAAEQTRRLRPWAVGRRSVDIGRGRRDCASSCRRIAASSARVSAVGSSPSSSSSKARNFR